jgi:hypothetical protein
MPDRDCPLFRLRLSLLAMSLLVLGGLAVRPATGQSLPSPDSAKAQLARAERAWLDTYVENDRATLKRLLADGFTITYPGGRMMTRDQVIGSVNPEEPPDDGPVHYTEDRSIRLIGRTAILTGVYVNPADEERPEQRARYTDTWMWIDGHWRVVASHLSALRQ